MTDNIDLAKTHEDILLDKLTTTIGNLSLENDKLRYAIECAIDALEDDKCRECNLDIAAKHVLINVLKGNE
jgi:hypothetical protein